METLTANGVEIAFDDSGHGAPVVLLGGSGMSSPTWDFSFRPALIQAGYRVITVDSRGVGESAAPPPPYSIPELARDVLALMDQLGIGRFRMVGLSAGGFVVEETCLQCPESVQAAALIGCAGRTTAYMRLKLQAEQALLDVYGHLPGPYEQMDALTITLPAAVLQDDDQTVEAWQALLAAAVNHPSEHGRLGQSAAVRQWLLDEQRYDRWEQLATPCAVIAFEHDLQFPPSRGREFADLLPSGAFVKIAGVAHGNGAFDAAGQLGETIIDFFDRNG